MMSSQAATCCWSVSWPWKCEALGTPDHPWKRLPQIPTPPWTGATARRDSVALDMIARGWISQDWIARASTGLDGMAQVLIGWDWTGRATIVRDWTGRVSIVQDWTGRV